MSASWRANQKVYLLKRCFNFCNSDVYIDAFKTYVLPLLEYCSPVWSPSSVGDIIRIESVLRQFTKFLNKYNNDLSYSDRLRKFNMSSLERRRLIIDLIFLYKIVNNIVIVDFFSDIKPLSSRTRGHSLRFQYSKPNTNLRANFFLIRTLKIWNCLSECTVTATSVNAFRTALNNEKLDKFLIFK